MSLDVESPAATIPEPRSLAGLLAGLARECDAAERTARAVERTVRKRHAGRPRALRRTAADAGLSLFAGGRSFAVVDAAEFYTPHAVEDLRGRTFTRDEPRPARPEDGYPPEVHTVIARVPCPATTARAAEIVAAFDAWTTANREADQAMTTAAAGGKLRRAGFTRVKATGRRHMKTEESSSRDPVEAMALIAGGIVRAFHSDFTGRRRWTPPGEPNEEIIMATLLDSIENEATTRSDIERDALRLVCTIVRRALPLLPAGAIPDPAVQTAAADTATAMLGTADDPIARHNAVAALAEGLTPLADAGYGLPRLAAMVLDPRGGPVAPLAPEARRETHRHHGDWWPRIEDDSDDCISPEDEIWVAALDAFQGGFARLPKPVQSHPAVERLARVIGDAHLSRARLDRPKQAVLDDLAAAFGACLPLGLIPADLVHGWPDDKPVPRSPRRRPAR